jgi:hypothetical protein
MSDGHTHRASSPPPMFFPSPRCDGCMKWPPRYTVGQQELCWWCCTRRLALIAVCVVGAVLLLYRLILDVGSELGTTL